MVYCTATEGLLNSTFVLCYKVNYLSYVLLLFFLSLLFQLRWLLLFFSSFSSILFLLNNVSLAVSGDNDTNRKLESACKQFWSPVLFKAMCFTSSSVNAYTTDLVLLFLLQQVISVIFFSVQLVFDKKQNAIHL